MHCYKMDATVIVRVNLRERVRVRVSVNHHLVALRTCVISNSEIRQTNTTYTSPQLEVHDEKQVGLCRKMSLHFLQCEYQSGMHTLYSEVDTGSCGKKKTATTNVALHVGLQDSTMGITKMRHILAATNTSPPSRCGLKRNADRVTAITAQATMDALKQKREQTK